MNQKRFLTVSLLLIVLSFAANAQSGNIQYEKGYRPDVELSWGNKSAFEITTSQGYNFGNGFYVGGGVGFSQDRLNDLYETKTYLVPVFAESKYTFTRTKLYPTIGVRTGVQVDINNSGMRYMLNPYLSLGLHRFALIVGYELCAPVAEIGKWATPGYADLKAINRVKLGIGFTF